MGWSEITRCRGMLEGSPPSSMSQPQRIRLCILEEDQAEPSTAIRIESAEHELDQPIIIARLFPAVISACSTPSVKAQPRHYDFGKIVIP